MALSHLTNSLRQHQGREGRERIKSEADLALTLSHNVNRHEASRDAEVIQEWIQELFQDCNQLDP